MIMEALLTLAFVALVCVLVYIGVEMADGMFGKEE